MHIAKEKKPWVPNFGLMKFNYSTCNGRKVACLSQPIECPLPPSSLPTFVGSCVCVSAPAPPPSPLSFPTPECQWWGIERFFLLSRPFQYSLSFPFFDGCSRSPAQSQGFSEADFGGKLPRTANYNTLRIYAEQPLLHLTPSGSLSLKVESEGFDLTTQSPLEK